MTRRNTPGRTARTTRGLRKIRQPVPIEVDVSPWRTAPYDDWSRYFASRKSRAALATLAAGINWRAVRPLKATLSPDRFAAYLLAYAPAANRWIPDDVRGNGFESKCDRALAAVAKVRWNAETGSGWDDRDSRALASFVVISAFGVRCASLRYAGGWDEWDASGGVHIMFRAGVCDEPDEALQRAQLLADILNIGQGCDAFVDLPTLLRSFAQDSGAGPPLYSQNVEINFTTGKSRLYGYEVDDSDGDDEGDPDADDES